MKPSFIAFMFVIGLIVVGWFVGRLLTLVAKWLMDKQLGRNDNENEI